MTTLAPPLQIAAAVAAVGWPFAAGLAVVLWSKARAAERQRRTAALEGDLRNLYQTVENKPVPDRLTLVVEALEEAEALKPAQPAATRKGRVAAT